MSRSAEYFLRRLDDQFSSYEALLGDATDAELAMRPEPTKWSAGEQLAHLTRYHEIFRARVERVLAIEGADLGRYRAEDDPEWNAWRQLPPHELWVRLRRLRQEFSELIGGLDDTGWSRTGVHPLFGRVALGTCLHFFLAHEAHHLYVAFSLLGRARLAARTGEGDAPADPAR